jgi:hypothetical protein
MAGRAAYDRPERVMNVGGLFWRNEVPVRGGGDL